MPYHPICYFHDPNTDIPQYLHPHNQNRHTVLNFHERTCWEQGDVGNEDRHKQNINFKDRGEGKHRNERMEAKKEDEKREMMEHIRRLGRDLDKLRWKL